MDQTIHVPFGIQVNFHNGCHVVFPPFPYDRKFHFRLVARHINSVVFDVDVLPDSNHSSKFNAQQAFFVPWYVEIFQNGKRIFTHQLNLTARSVCIDMRSADRKQLSHWMPSVLKFQDEHNPHLTIVMEARFIPIFRDVCLGMRLIPPSEYKEEDYYASYPLSVKPIKNVVLAPKEYSENDPTAYSDAVLMVKSERTLLCAAPEEDIKFSICIPAYNEEEYLPACLDSLLAQTYRNFEILLCDDKSKDDTLHICRKYERMDSRVKVLENPENMGGLITRNKLFSKASGEYSLWGDADDTYEPDFLERGVNILHQKRYDIVEFPYDVLLTTGEKNFFAMPVKEFEADSLAEFFLSDKHPRRWLLWGKIFRTELIKKAMPPNFRELYDDVFFALPLFHYAKSYRFAMFNHPLYHYFIRTNGTWYSAIFDNKDLEKFRKFCKMRSHEVTYNVDFIRSNNLPEKLILPLIEASDVFDLPKQIKKFDESKRKQAIAIFHSFFGKDGNLINDYPLPYDATTLLREIDSLAMKKDDGKQETSNEDLH